MNKAGKIAFAEHAIIHHIIFPASKRKAEELIRRNRHRQELLKRQQAAKKECAVNERAAMEYMKEKAKEASSSN